MDELITDLKTSFSLKLSEFFSLPPWFFIIGALIIALIITLVLRKPFQLFFASLLLVGVWIVAMPTGMDNIQYVSKQKTVENKVLCAREIASSTDYWTYKRSGEEACKMVHIQKACLEAKTCVVSYKLENGKRIKQIQTVKPPVKKTRAPKKSS